MDLLTRLERVLEGMVEGVFSRTFRAQLQPIEIAKRLVREVENHRTVGVSGTYVPNLYTVSLEPETLAGFTPISGRLLEELEQYLREFCLERAYQLVGPITVRLTALETLKANEMRIEATSDPLAIPSAAPSSARLRTMSSGETTRTPIPRGQDPTTLEILAGEGSGRRVPLVDGLTLGRGPANSLVLHEPNISRHHAEIIHQEEGWMLRDLGSTNGTYVNGHRITALTLQVGDEIALGSMLLRVL
jgi:hypothetical protein